MECTMEHKNYIKSYAQKYRLLYVEDDENVSKHMSSIFSLFFKEVYVAYDGLEGLQMYKELQPDLVITDIVMPKMDGLELSKSILALDDKANITVITAHTEKSYLLEALDIGLDRFLLKPIQEGKLYETLHKAIYDLEYQRHYEKALEERDMLKFMMELSPVFTVLLHTDSIRYMNKAFLNFLGYDSTEHFSLEHDCLCHLIKDEDGEPLFRDKQMCSLHMSDYDKEMIVYMYNIYKERFSFQLHIHYFPQTDTFLLVFTDITQLNNQKNHLEYLAEIDALTSLYNKRKFDEYLQTSLTLYKARKIEVMSILMFDIDNFKTINDTLGHQEGDKILRSLSLFIKSHIRKGDFLARWGGEEFILVLSNTMEKEAYTMAERFRRGIFDHFDGSLSCSLGVTTFQKDDSAKELFHRVDSALYKAKDAGKNCTKVVNKMEEASQ